MTDPALIWEREWWALPGTEYVWAWRGDWIRGPVLFAWPPGPGGIPPPRFSPDQVFYYILYHYADVNLVVLMDYQPKVAVEVIRVEFETCQQSEGAFRQQRQTLLALLPTIISIAKTVGIGQARYLMASSMTPDDTGPTRIIDLKE